MNKNYRIIFSSGSVVLFFILGVFLSSRVSGQEVSTLYQINWLPNQYLRLSETDSILRISFNGAIYDDKYDFLPVYSIPFQLNSAGDSLNILEFNDLVFDTVPSDGLMELGDDDKIPASIEPEQTKSFQRKIPYGNISFLPMRRNSVTGKIEKLLSFGLRVEIVKNATPAPLKSERVYAANSVLMSGTWYKMSVNANGIYKLTSDNLKSMGIDVASLNPKNIRIYGNGGGMLPEANAAARIDDLREIAIQVAGEEDGKFDAADYVLFYGESPDKWRYDTTGHLFHHSKNIYSDVSCYFISTDLGPGKRIGSEPSTTQTPTNFVNTFNDHQFYEKDDVNILKSGRSWFDQQYFDVTTTRDYTFNFPNINGIYPGTITTDVAAGCPTSSSSFQVSVNDQPVKTISIPQGSNQFLYQLVYEVAKAGNFTSTNPVIDVKLVYNKPDINAIGYLNYLELNVIRNLVMAGSQMSFRSASTYGHGVVSEFDLQRGSQPVTIWDVTNTGDAAQVGTTLNGQTTVFRLAADTLREFIAFDGSSFLSPKFVSKVDNQDLHGAGIFDDVIVTNPLFISQAEELADFHRKHDHMTVLVTTTDKIYNEFSSGTQDLSAIRDFMKMIYDKAGAGEEPKYLLLFGDASYDYKDRVQNNSNMIPSYESNESLNPVGTYVSDDYFVLLDNSEGQNASGLLDVGVGRFPVQTVDQAQAAINKIEHYCDNIDSVKNDWRNVVCFVADDWDNNLHLQQADTIASGVSGIEKKYKEYNVDKIYLDAYQAESTPGGLRNPDVNAAINQRVNKGALIMNYTGHGGTLGWAHERVLEIADIQSWTNFDRMPVFVTATCEFSWFDDPSWISAGEWVFLNPTGGGIALFTTTRPTYAGDNFTLSKNFYDNVFKKINGKYPKMGDLIVSAKNITGGSPNSRKFVLLGDPALQLEYPENEVVTTSINGSAVSSTPDTLKALAKVTITGEIRDNNGVKMSGFNGTVFPTVLDKAEQISTVANVGGTPTRFYLRKNALYKGKIAVTNGDFSFSFIVPKDIAYNYGFGKISYYARDPETDANGYNDNMIVGGFANSKNSDTEGPIIKLYMNDTNFVSGGITDQNPALLAFIYDSSGINTVGSGIGHDITAVLDNDTRNSYILNDYYVSDLDTYKSGEIGYPFFNLPDGTHQITLKVWDVYNNSAEGTIDFVVFSTAQFALQNLMNFPNPFSDHTTFSFEYNQPNSTLDVDLKIFSLTGRLIKTLHQVVNTSGYKIETIVWDGTGNDGSKISAGMYVYHLTTSLPDGSTVRKSSKLIYFK
jgi:hypothetical protein